MSGHNKWSKVKHKKAAEDKKKSKIFSMHARLIALESKKSGGDESSPSLKNAVERARAVNMPNENIHRAIARGAGSEGGSLEEVLYEAYGPGGAAILILGVTDSKNRTSSEIKKICTDGGAHIVPPGSASWAFVKNGDEFHAQNTITLSEDDARILAELTEKLEGHDDVRALFTNASV